VAKPPEGKFGDGQGKFFLWRDRLPLQVQQHINPWSGEKWRRPERILLFLGDAAPKSSSHRTWPIK